MAIEPASAQPRTGALLIAQPTLADPNFKRSVVLLAEHSERGTMGYVLNRRLDLTLRQVMSEELAALDFDAPLYWGGPCQTDTLHCLHAHGARVPDSTEVLRGVSWGGNFEAICEMIARNDAPASDFHFFLGYAGWGDGQLVRELEERSWLLRSGASAFVFAESSKNMWTRAVRSLGGEYVIAGNTPEHPSLN